MLNVQYTLLPSLQYGTLQGNLVFMRLAITFSNQRLQSWLRIHNAGRKRWRLFFCDSSNWRLLICKFWQHQQPHICAGSRTQRRLSYRDVPGCSIGTPGGRRVPFFLPVVGFQRATHLLVVPVQIGLCLAAASTPRDAMRVLCWCRGMP